MRSLRGPRLYIAIYMHTNTCISSNIKNYFLPSKLIPIKYCIVIHCTKHSCSLTHGWPMPDASACSLKQTRPLGAPDRYLYNLFHGQLYGHPNVYIMSANGRPRLNIPASPGKCHLSYLQWRSGGSAMSQLSRQLIIEGVNYFYVHCSSTVQHLDFIIGSSSDKTLMLSASRATVYAINRDNFAISLC